MSYIILREGTESYDRHTLQHFGIKGQKWGVRRFENSDGTLTEEGKIRYAKAQKEASKYESKSSRLKKIGRAARTGAAAGAAGALGALAQVGYASPRDFVLNNLRSPTTLGSHVAGIVGFALAGALGGAAVSSIKQGVQAAKVKRGQKFVEDYRSAYEKTYGVHG